MKNVEIEYSPSGMPYAKTLNHWNNKAWFNQVCNVVGIGKHRFNSYNKDGFAVVQYRFKTKADAIEWLLYYTYCRPLHWAKEDDPQYEVRTVPMEVY